MAVLLCLKRQFAGLRYGLYIMRTALRDSSVDRESFCLLPFAFCLRGWERTRGRVDERGYSPFHSFQARRRLGRHCKCISCVAHCSFAKGRFTRWVVFKYLPATSPGFTSAARVGIRKCTCTRLFDSYPGTESNTRGPPPAITKMPTIIIIAISTSAAYAYGFGAHRVPRSPAERCPVLP